MLWLYSCVTGLVIFFVLRWAGRSLFSSVGARALAQQPDEIHLEPRPSHIWGNPGAVETHTKELLACGFTDAGTFAIREMPPVTLRLFAKPEEGACATIYEHSKVGVWLDMFARHEDDTGFTIATTQNRGLDQRPGRPILHIPGLSATDLYARFRRDRPQKPSLSIPAEKLPGFYELSYAEQMIWRKQKGISATEVARVAKTRAD